MARSVRRSVGVQEAKMFRNVLIGIDGRQGGRDAIALARQLAAREATLTLGHVCANPRPRRC